MSADKNVFDNPLSADETDDASLGTPSFESGTPSFELDGRGSAISKASSSPTQKARSVFGSRPAADVENPLVERLGDMTTEQVIGLFKSLDLDGNGMIDVEEMVVLMGLLGKPADEESVLDMMQIMGAKSDEGVELGEFMGWWQTEGRFANQSSNGRDHGYARASNASKRMGTKLAAPLKKAKNMVAHDATVDAAQKGVSPESMFVVDKSGNDAHRQLGEASALIHQAFESEFHHLEDVITGQEGATHWLEPWEAEVVACFDEQEMLDKLGWSQAAAAEARALFENKERLASYRLFLQSDPLSPPRRKRGFLAAKGRALLRQQSLDPADDPLRQPTSANIVREATAYLQAGLGHDDQWLDMEQIPFERALAAIRNALMKECKFRQFKMQALAKRLEEVQDTPRKITVNGLRGDAAVANGLYVADGLRACWGRPLYVQQLSSYSGSHVAHYCFFDMQHETDADGNSRWTNGCWIIGPTLNSERCTCWLPQKSDVYKHPVASTNLAKAATRDRILGKATTSIEDSAGFGTWQVFDTLAKAWASAPGIHCPAFSVEVAEDNEATMRDYITKAIDHESRMLKRAQETMGTGSTLELLVGGHKTAEGQISREGFYTCGMQYYQEEVRNAQNSLRQKILNQANVLLLDDDPDQQQELVDEVLTSFSWTCARKIQNRKLEKRKFVSRLERPTLSRAFYSWKFHWRQSSASSMLTGGTFAEPSLPWNVRHPRSTFSNWWEASQALLLVYVSFNVIWRVTFNTKAVGFYYYFETGIDLYFVVDIILNLHTAFYDRSGDLQGLHPAGRVRGIWNIIACNSGADLKRLYVHYARGWMFVDVVSVFPWSTVYEYFSETFGTGVDDADKGSEAKVLKILRLLRLTKLLRLIRGMRIIKKYEEQLGPSISAAMLIGTVMLVLHGMTCAWYFVGTLNTLNDAETSVPGAQSAGWVEKVFKGSSRLCSCYDGGLDRNGEPQGYFFDAFDNVCLHPNDLEGEIHDVCPGTIGDIPEPIDYYYKAMFTALKDTSVTPGYLHSVWELVVAAIITGIMGFMWGAVAGVWSSIFQANQLAGQKFYEKMAHLKEFCRIKGLDWGTRSKLIAYYEHLYPEQVIVDEKGIIDELPPGMRTDLVKQIYGPVIATVPLFFGLGSDVLTEICLCLGTLPTLKGEVMMREGVISHEMYCIAEGSCRVTQHIRGGDDEERVRIWIEEVFAANYSITKLYEPNQRVLLQKLMKRMAVLARDSPNGDTVTYRKLVNDEKISVMLETPRALIEATATLNTLLALAKKQGRVQYRGALRLESAVPAVGLVPGKSQRNGPTIQLLPKPDLLGLKWETSLELMCGALKDGVLLCRLLNYFLDARKIDIWTGEGLVSAMAGIATDAVDIAGGLVSGSSTTAIAIADKTAAHMPDLVGGKVIQKGVDAVDTVQDATLGRTTRMATQGATGAQSAVAVDGPRRNIQNFLDALQDPLRMFNTGDNIVAAMSLGGGEGQKGALFSADDLLSYDKGTLQEQEKKQKRVVSSLLELGLVVSSLPGYLGVCIDEINLGTLQAGEFFGELSLLPLKGGWRCERTVTAVQNGMLYYITRAAIESVASRFSDLKHKLNDHVEDWQRMRALQPKVHGLAIVKEQLDQQSVTLMDQERKLSELEASIQTILALCESMNARLPPVPQ